MAESLNTRVWTYRGIFICLAAFVVFVKLLPLHPGPGRFPRAGHPSAHGNSLGRAPARVFACFVSGGCLLSGRPTIYAAPRFVGRPGRNRNGSIAASVPVAKGEWLFDRVVGCIGGRSFDVFGKFAGPCGAFCRPTGPRFDPYSIDDNSFTLSNCSYTRCASYWS